MDLKAIRTFFRDNPQMWFILVLALLTAGTIAFSLFGGFTAEVGTFFAAEPTDNPLPVPNHQIDFGYYFVDGRYGDFRTEVACYTNLYYAWAWRNYPTDQDWRPLMTQSLINAVAEGRKIHLNANQENTTTLIDDVLDVAAPYWNSVTRVELADEPGWTLAETEQRIAAFKANVQARGLADRPVGIVFTQSQVLTTDALSASNLDWVGIEAYIDPPGSDTSQVNVDALISYVNQAKARVPNGKNIVLVMQAYARNGAWANIATLTDLQAPVYLLGYNDPRVIAITMFSYGRPSGTREHVELTVPHKQIGERLGYTCATPTPIPTVTVTATPIPTSTNTPVSTATPTPTPYPTVTVSVSPTTSPVTGTFTITKEVRNMSLNQTQTESAVTVDPGQTLQFIIRIHADQELRNVLVRDALPVGMSYIPGSTLLQGALVASDAITTTGITIGVIPASETVTIRWSAIADRTQDLGNGQQVLRPQAFSTVSDTTLYDSIELTIRGTLGGGTSTPTPLTGPGAVPTGPGDALVISMGLAATLTLLYTAYTRSASFRRKEIEHISKDKNPMDFRG